MLHIAPEQCFHKRFKSLSNIDYVTGDLESPLADHHFDLHQIPFPDQSFDAIICNHVLEHVADDRQCARELFRVLKPGGWAIMQVPIDYSREVTLEDPSITSAADRELHYWQKDHMRLFGLDYPKRLAESGFSVRIDDFVNSLDAGLREKYRLQKEELIYFLTRE